MDTLTEPGKKVPVVRDVDVAVVGGGPSGFVAAVAAARLGAKVLLLERYGYLGGLATGGLVLYMDGIYDGDGKPQISGLVKEIFDRLRRLDGLVEEAPGKIHVDSEMLKVVADRMCLDAGVELRLHSWAVDAVVDDRGIDAVLVEGKSGRQAIRSKVFVDATGDGDVAAFAGAAFELGTQRIGLNLKVCGIDRARYESFVKREPERLTKVREEVAARGGYPLHLAPTPHSDAGVFWINIRGLAGTEDTAASDDTAHDFFAGSLSGIDVEDLTYSEVELRKRILASLELYRNGVAGFENVRIISFASQLGVRDSRRIAGISKLSKGDVQSGRSYEDGIGRAALHFASRRAFEVPLGCLIPMDVDRLLIAGRCISADSWCQQAVRLIPPAMMTGQAAGSAAALAVRYDRGVDRLDVEELRGLLSAGGVIL
jgi:hypothetical protein